MSVTHGAGGGAGHAAVVSQVEHLQRALREAQAEAARFSSLLEQQRRESDRLGAELLPARKALAAQRAEQERGARELALARQLRAEAEARRGESDEALRRLEKKGAAQPRAEAAKELMALAQSAPVLPGDAGWPLGAIVAAPRSPAEAEQLRLLLRQLREATVARLLDRVFAQDPKHWLAFAKRKFMGKEFA